MKEASADEPLAYVHDHVRLEHEPAVRASPAPRRVADRLKARMRSFTGAVPLSVVAVALAVVIALLAGGAVAAWLRSQRSVATLLLFGFGLVISATLVPTAAALQGEVSDGVCDLSRVGLASVHELTRVSFASLNVLLFVPLGLAVGLLPRTRPAGVVALAALSLTFVVEAVQLLLPVLGRGCETADMVDNLLGLALGIGLGALSRPILRARAVSGRA